MTLLDQDEERWYCYDDDVIFYAKEERWSEKAFTSTRTVGNGGESSNQSSPISFSDIHQNKRLRVLLAGVLMLQLVLQWLRPITGVNMYFVGLSSGIAIYVVLVWWEVRRMFPAGGLGVTDEKFVSIHASINRTYEAACTAVKNCGWKLIETNPETWSMKAKIGRSIQTLYGQLFIIFVKKAEETSSTVKITCSTLYQIKDYGRNSKMIEKFTSRLQKQLNST